MDWAINLLGIDVSVHLVHILIKSDSKFPVGAGPLALPEALRIFSGTLLGWRRRQEIYLKALCLCKVALRH